MNKPSRDIIYDKLLQIESWAYRARHIIEVNPDDERVIESVKRIRHDLEDLEVTLKIE